MRLTPPLRVSLKVFDTVATKISQPFMDFIVPSDAYATELAERINIGYGLCWLPEHVQYWATRADLLLDDTLVDFIDLIAHHEFLTKDV